MAATHEQTDTTTEVQARADDLAHLTCCRSAWEVSFCGMRGLPIDLVERREVCSMCVEEVHRLRPSFPYEEEYLCPHDGEPCPSDGELDAMAERFLGLRP